MISPKQASGSRAKEIKKPREERIYSFISIVLCTSLDGFIMLELYQPSLLCMYSFIMFLMIGPINVI